MINQARITVEEPYLLIISGALGIVIPLSTAVRPWRRSSNYSMTIPVPDRVTSLETRIGYGFIDRRLLEEALTHRSYLNEAGGKGTPCNERLEFFGDAVLSLFVSKMLLELFPMDNEGKLSRLRASFIDEASLAALAESLDLGSALTLGRGEERSGGREKKSILADAFEALIGALYLDGGEAPAQHLVRTLFTPLMERFVAGESFRDHKTEFQELVQERYGSTPVYILVDTAGPPHDRRFTVEAHIGAEQLGRGVGRSKKEAEQAAAREALARLKAGSGSGE